jgi:hypothetical protein
LHLLENSAEEDLRREKLMGDWRKFHNEELHNLYCLPNIRIIKLRRMRLTEYVECIRELRCSYTV